MQLSEFCIKFAYYNASESRIYVFYVIVATIMVSLLSASLQAAPPLPGASALARSYADEYTDLHGLPADVLLKKGAYYHDIRHRLDSAMACFSIVAMRTRLIWVRKMLRSVWEATMAAGRRSSSTQPISSARWRICRWLRRL